MYGARNDIRPSGRIIMGVSVPGLDPDPDQLSRPFAPCWVDKFSTYMKTLEESQYNQHQGCTAFAYLVTVNKSFL